MDRRIKSSRNQEKRVAKDLGGRLTPGSGNGWAVKNDLRTEAWSIECKTTEKTRYTLTHAALTTAERHALLDNRDMAFVLDMCGRTWAVLSFDAFARLIDEEA